MKKTTWVLLGIVLAFLAVILLWERRQPTTGEREESKLKPFDFKKDEITLAGRTGEAPLTLKKGQDEEWALTFPVSDAADRYAVEELVERIADIKAIRWVEGDAPRSTFGLDPPRAVWELKGGGTSLRLEVGGQAGFGEGLYVKAGSRVALLSPEIEGLLLKPVAEFRSHELTGVKAQDVQALRFLRPDGTTLAFERSGGSDWSLTAPFEDWGDGDKLQMLLDDVCACPVFGFADGNPADPAPFGLDKPQKEVELVLSGGRRVQVRLGSAVPGTEPGDARVYASATGRPSVMIVSLNSLKSLDQDPESLRLLTAFRRDLYEVEHLEVRGVYSVKETRGEEGGWKFEAPKEPPPGADPSVLPSALLELRGEKALPADDASSLGLAQPDFTVTASGKGFEEKVFIGAERGGRRYAKAEKRAAALLLPPEDWNRIQEALKLAAGKGLAAPST